MDTTEESLIEYKAIARLPLDVTTISILGRTKDPKYRDIGHNMKVDDLYKMLGLKGSPMLYHYMSGKTESIEPERAVVILDRFDILIDQWETEEELRREAVNTELSNQIAREPFIKLMDMLIKVEEAPSMTTMKQGIRKILARFY